MKKLLALFLITSFIYSNETFKSEDAPSVFATCNFYWDLQSDIKECMETFKSSKRFEDVWLPVGAEMKTMNELNKADKKTKAVMSNNKTTKSVTKTSVNKTNCEFTKKYGTNEEYINCRKKVSKEFQKIWKNEIQNKFFELTSDSREYFVLYADGSMLGYTYATTPDDDGKNFGFDMGGAWEMSNYSYSSQEFGYIEMYAGKLKCTYSISKKGKLFWFEQKKANYSNVCPSMLMKSKQQS